MKYTKIIKPEGLLLDYSGKYDKTKVVSPDILRLPDGTHRLYYVGTNCEPSERKGYNLLVAQSRDGHAYRKRGKLILDLEFATDKHYSPKVIYHNSQYVLYYGLGRNGKYVIASAISDDGLTFTPRPGINIDITEYHKAAIHSPKIFIANNQIHMFYTGSNEADKIYSKKYPKYDFANQFYIFYTYSKDGIHFKRGKKINIQNSNFINIYGHNVYYKNDTIYIFFAGFDGSINKLYFSFSKDKIHFSKPQLLIAPNPKKNELGIYSCSLQHIKDDIFRLAYGVRLFDNHWQIKSALLAIQNS